MPELPAFDRRAGVAVALDVVVVAIFTLIGRQTHDEAFSIGGWLGTALPFLLGLAVGWALVATLSRAWPTRLGTGITVWASTLVVGMLLRAISGQGTALSFIIVATIFLGATLIGWRAVQEVMDNRGTEES